MSVPVTGLFLKTLGEPCLYKHGVEIDLPPSKKTRALLVFLALTGRPHRRARLCEMFWHLPDDPRGALRWSLTKIRSLVNEPHCERLQADRERVSLLLDTVDIDIVSIAHQLKENNLGLPALTALQKQLQEPFLDGLDLFEEDLFQQWLTAERMEVTRLQGRTLALMCAHNEANRVQRLEWARKWSELEPMSPVAATRLVAELAHAQADTERLVVTQQFVTRFRNAGITWSPDSQPVSGKLPMAGSENLSRRDFLMKQKINFCQTTDGVRLAYASVGTGLPIIKAANWLSHIEHDWESPIWSPLFRNLANDHRVIRYDERGNGLSDWDVPQINFDAFVSDLETVVDATGIETFSLLGISQGAAVSIEYAVRHPERVKHLILFGGYDAGWRIDATPDEIREREAIMTLTESGWGRDNPAYRQIFSSTFMPSANAAELAWFNEFQRLTTSPKNAVRFLSVFGDIDVRHQLARINVPTLVIHSLRDCRIPARIGRHLAAKIPKAEFVGLNSDGHLLLGREPASNDFIDVVKDFIARH